MRLLLLMLAVAFMHTAMAQSLPELGDASATAVSPQLEKRIGEEAYREIRFRDPKYLDDPELTEYVSNLGSRLVQASQESRQPFEFFLVRDSTINAFAMPGGFVGVHTGLLLAAQTESEVASVLAHEVSHVTQHHIARMINQGSQVTAVSLAAMLLAVLAARSNPEMAQAAIASASAGSIQAQLSFSRDFEREADRLGFQLLRDAGFDVHAMPVFFERLQRFTRIYDNNAPSYLSSHPVTTERIADMQNRAYAVPYKQIPDSLDFHFVRAKLRADQGTSADAVLQARSQLKEGRYASEAGARYALVSALMRDRSLAAADKELAALKASTAPHPMIDMLEARLRSAQGNRQAARDILKAARVRFPNSHAVSYALVDAYQSTGQHKEALKELDELIRVNGRDPSLYSMRARSLDAVGDSLRVHQALAEEYYLRGSLPAAIEQLQIAQKSAKGDFYELSVLEARLRQLRGEMSDQAKLK